MPYKPKHPCSYPGCPALTDRQYCPVHKKLTDALYDKYQRYKPSREFYNSKEWKKKRADFLIEHPFCEECRREGRLTAATVVDHITPIRMGGAELDDNNLQALCASCHTKKSILEGSRFGRRS